MVSALDFGLNAPGSKTSWPGPCVGVRHFTFIVLLSTQVYKWVLAYDYFCGKGHTCKLHIFCFQKQVNSKFAYICNIGECDKTVEQVCKLLVHMNHPEVFWTLGVTPPRGFLLHAPPPSPPPPPICGKTLLAQLLLLVCSPAF